MRHVRPYSWITCPQDPSNTRRQQSAPTIGVAVPLPTGTGEQPRPPPARRPAGRPDRSMSLLPLFLRPAARFLAALVAGRAAEAAASVLHRAGALPRNRGLERLVRDDDLLDGRGAGAGVCIARLVVGVMRCLC